MTPTASPPRPRLRTATVIGCGARGLAVARALRAAGVEVHLLDQDPRAVVRAQELGAGTLWLPGRPADDLVVVATPPAAVVDVLYEAQARGLGHAYTDIAATDAKESIVAEARLRGCDLLGYVPGTPPDPRPAPATAGAGPFTGRTWILCPYDDGDPAATAAVDALVRLCGALRRDLTPAQHDRVVAARVRAPRRDRPGQLSNRGDDLSPRPLGP